MRRVFATVALATFAILGTAGPALAQQHCDSYSGACVEGKKIVKPPTKPTEVGGIDLPFTGAAITGMVVVGAAAIAGGTVLVTAGRRRRTTA